MRIRQISNFPIKFLLMLMGAMPFGSISVCKLEADEEEEGVEGGQDRGNLWLSLAGLPGSEATEAASSSWHPPGVCTSIAPGAALTINILNFFKMQKPHQQTLDHRVFQGGNFLAFFQSCVQVEDVGGLNGWRQAGQIGGRGESSPGAAALPRPGLYRGWHDATRLLPPTLPLLNNQPDRRSTRHGQPAMFVLARPLWPALFTCLPLAATRAQAQPAWPRWGQ